jgi:hypothetical protein
MLLQKVKHVKFIFKITNNLLRGANGITQATLAYFTIAFVIFFWEIFSIYF